MRDEDGVPFCVFFVDKKVFGAASSVLLPFFLAFERLVLCFDPVTRSTICYLLFDAMIP